MGPEPAVQQQYYKYQPDSRKRGTRFRTEDGGKGGNNGGEKAYAYPGNQKNHILDNYQPADAGFAETHSP